MSIIVLAAVLAATQSAGGADAAPPENPIKVAAMSFADCVRGKVPAVSPDVTPEAGADSVIAACGAEEAKLRAAVDATVATAPAEKQAEARKAYADGMAQGRAGIIEGIKGMREGKKPAGN